MIDYASARKLLLKRKMPVHIVDKTIDDARSGNRGARAWLRNTISFYERVSAEDSAEEQRAERQAELDAESYLYRP